MQAEFDRDAQAELNNARLAVIAEHGRCERVEDWDGVLATMIDEPCYVFYPNRLRARGAVAIKEWWRRTHWLRDDPDIRRRAIGKEPFFNDEGVALMSIIDHTVPHERGESEPERLFLTVLAIFRFDGLKIASESAFFDRKASPHLDTVLESQEFLATPGVERF